MNIDAGTATASAALRWASNAPPLQGLFYPVRLLLIDADKLHTRNKNCCTKKVVQAVSRVEASFLGFISIDACHKAPGKHYRISAYYKHTFRHAADEEWSPLYICIAD